MRINIVIKPERLASKLSKVKASVRAAIKAEATVQSEKLARHLIVKHLTGGTTRSRLKVRTGKLRDSVVARRPKEVGTGFEWGVNIGAKYASTHISKRPKTTVIYPERADYLTIPIAYGLDSRGVARRKHARDWKRLKVIKSKKGNLILADIRKVEGETEILPYYVLKKSVKVKSRVHLEEIISRLKSGINASFDRSIKRAIK